MSLTDPYGAGELRNQVATLQQTLNNVYRERAHLVALLSALYPSALAYSDPDTPDWPVVTVETGKGQLSWHIGPGDVDLFEHLPPAADGTAPVWDGHSTDEKYARIRELTAAVAGHRSWVFVTGQEAPQEAPDAQEAPQEAPDAQEAPQEPAKEAPAPKRRGRPRKSAQAAPETPQES